MTPQADTAALAMGGTAACITLALVLAQAGWHALRDQPDHAAAITAYRLLPDWAASPAAWALPILNLAAAALLIAPALRAPGAALAAFLLAIFTAAIGINLQRGITRIDCGCGGANGQKLSLGLVVRNLVIMVGLVIAATAPETGAVDAATTVCVIGASLALIALYFAANQLMTNLQALSALGSRS